MKPLQSVGVAVLLVTVCLAVDAANRGALIDIRGAIGPATVDYIVRATETAGRDDVVCLVVRLDTPGGLLDSTKEIVQAFYRSSVPIVVYVAPAGANAGSAGVFITLATDVAVMAPNTTIGAAHPVSMGAPADNKEGTRPDTMAQKIENFAVSFIESIAERHDRNVDWARAAVRESASVTAEKALELKVIDLIARDEPDLLRQLDGRVVRGKTLATAGAELTPIPMLMRERVFQMLWRPEVLLVLMLVAIYGIVGELSNPGAILPGVCGAIALILALYMAAVLPVNAAGMALIALAVLLFIADAIATTHGVLTVGGLIAFFLGGMLLFDGAPPSFRLSPVMLLPATLITGAFFVFCVSAGLRAQLLPAKAGRETLVGRTAEALTDFSADGHGRVFVDGEDWEASCASPIARGQRVRISAVHGLSLTVQAVSPVTSP